MELKSVLPWGILVSICLGLVYGLGQINHGFANLAPGIFIIGMMVLSISQINKYLKSRKPKFKTAV